METSLHQQVLSYLSNHQVMTLATVGPESPWAAAVFYVNKDYEFYFLSAAHTRHAQNIAQNGLAAAAIHEDYKDWPSIKGIQLEGEVKQLFDIERELAISLFAEKYPFIKDAPAELKAGLEKVSWYRLSAAKLFFIDNSKGFGHRDKVL